MRHRLAGFVRSFTRLRGQAAVPAGSPVDAWRFDPAGWENLWSRAGAIHLPAGDFARRFFQPTRPTVGPGGIASFALGPTGDFLGYRQYEPGDDPRDVDWQATARTRRPMVRQRRIETRRPVGIVVDVSASLWVDYEGSRTGVRSIDMAFEAAVWLAAAALECQAPVTLSLVSDRPELQLPAMTGRRSIDRIVKSLRSFRPERTATDWFAVDTIRNPPQAGSFVFWISDFTWLPDPAAFRTRFARWVSLAVRVTGNMPESTVNDAILADVETGLRFDAAKPISAASIAARAGAWSAQAGVPVVELATSAARPELILADWSKSPRLRTGNFP